MKKRYLLLSLAALFWGCQSTPQEPTPEEEPPAQVSVSEPAPTQASVSTSTQAPAPAPVEGPSSEALALVHYNRGNEYYNRHDFDNAVREYAEALNLYPGMADAYIAKGNAHSGKLEFQEAMNNYTIGAELNSFYEHYARGYSQFLTRDYRSAIDEFSQSITQRANLVAAYNDRGLSFANAGNLDLAITDYNEALKLSPNLAFPFNNRGNAYLSMGKYDNAIEDYAKTIELYPEMSFPYTGRGYAYSAIGEKDLAEADFAAAEKLK